MRLSEAMILGSTIKKHVPHLSQYGKGEEEGCALQLAGLLDEYGGWAPNEALTFFAYQPDVSCPQCRETVSFFTAVAVHLNDLHKWSIDRIAEWVDQFEPREQEAPAPTVETDQPQLQERQ